MSLHKIVVISREAEIRQLAKRFGREILVADDPAEALEITVTARPDLILFDNLFCPGDVRQFLDTTDKNSIHVPVVVVGNSQENEESSETFIKAGAFDYLRDRHNHEQFEQIIAGIKSASQNENREKQTNDFFCDELSTSVSMAGTSRAIADTLKMIKLVGTSQCNPVLIVGETGTGKELAAKAIHALRGHKEPFVAVNCAAMTANLLESELFGHTKGSFTGADRDKTGLLELAGAGTLFLDEISEMPLNLQPKLLRVLQEKTFRKVGGLKNITCKATMVASSNRYLLKEVQANRFRRDLYYRLNVCPISIAPLRSPERKQDIQLLAEYFLRYSTICPQKKGRIKSLTKLAIESLEKHDWPGNVRELRNTIERAILLESTDKIGLSSIIIDQPQSAHQFNSLTAERIKDFSLEKAERKLIQRALRETGWQKTRAAALLGITRATLYAKVKQYNIERDSKLESHQQTPQSSYTIPEAAAVM